MIAFLTGCTPSMHSAWADRVAYAALDNARSESVPAEDLHDREAFSISAKTISVADVLGDRLDLSADGPILLTLKDCLIIAFRNNLEFQAKKEDLYLEALAVANARHDWSGFGAFGEGQVTRTITERAPGDNTVDSATGEAGLSFTQKLAHGGIVTLGAGLRIASDLLGADSTIAESFLGATFTQPLLRGAWFGFAYEDLYRDERNLLISTYEFERYTQTFCIEIIKSYYGVLQARDRLNNERANIERLELALRQTAIQVRGGQLTKGDMDQAERDLLNARVRLMSQTTEYRNTLDQFKLDVGIPLSLAIELNNEALEQLRTSGPARVPLLDEAALDAVADKAAAQAARNFDRKNPEHNDPILMQVRQTYIERQREIAYDAAYDQAAGKSAGEAMQLALHTQPEVLREIAKVRDARRNKEKAANDFLPGLDLESSIYVNGTAPRRVERLQFHRSRSLLGASLDYDFDQTDNRDAYRQAEIIFDRTRRNALNFVSNTQQDISQQYRTLIETRRTYDIRLQSLTTAQRKQKFTAMQLNQGRAEIRDVLEAEEDLRNAQNNLTSTAIDYETARLDFLASLGMLDVNKSGHYAMRSDPQLFSLIEDRYGGIETILQYRDESGPQNDDSQDLSLNSENHGNSEI